MIFHVKYIPFILVGLAVLVGIFYVFKKEHILRWIISTMETNGKPDAKKIAGFACVNTLLIGYFICIYYGDKHEPPEWYAMIIAGLIVSFFGLREIGRFVTSKYGGTTPGSSVIESTSPSSVPGSKNVKETNVPPAAPGTTPVANDEIG